MTQSAQSHRQMRSIPRCPKAVFYVFVSVPSIFPLNRFNVCLQMGWNGAILGGILGGRREVGESFAGFLAQGSILRVKEWTNEQFFARKVAF